MNRSLLLALLIFGPPLLVWADTQYNLRVDGMACPYCAYGIEKKLKALDGIIDESLEIKLNDGIVRFQASDETVITKSSLKLLINDSGFTLRELEIHSVQQEQRKGDSSRL